MRELAYLNGNHHHPDRQAREEEEDGSYNRKSSTQKTALKEFVVTFRIPTIHHLLMTLSIWIPKTGYSRSVRHYYVQFRLKTFTRMWTTSTPSKGILVGRFPYGTDTCIEEICRRSARLLEKAKVEISGEDFREGLIAVISVKVSEPQFEGQPRPNWVTTKWAVLWIRLWVKPWLITWKNIRKKPNDCRQSGIGCATACRRPQRLVNQFSVKVRWAAAVCWENWPTVQPWAEECELFLVEGDSAGGSAFKNRKKPSVPGHPAICAVNSERWKKPCGTKRSKAMKWTTSFRPGVRFGVDWEAKKANIDKLRYHKVHHHDRCRCRWFSHRHTDHDIMFYRYMPEVIQGGHLFISFTPPLYKCSKGKISEYCYTDDESPSGFHPEIWRMGTERHPHPALQRFGWNESEQLWNYHESGKPVSWNR